MLKGIPKRCSRKKHFSKDVPINLLKSVIWSRQNPLQNFEDREYYNIVMEETARLLYENFMSR